MDELRSSGLTKEQEITAIKYALDLIAETGKFAEIFYRVLDSVNENSGVVLPIGIWASKMAAVNDAEELTCVTSALFDLIKKDGVDNLPAIYDSVMYDGNRRREGWAVDKAGESLGWIARAAEELAALGVDEEDGHNMEDVLWNAATYMVRIYAHLSLPDHTFKLDQYKNWTEQIITDGRNGYRLFANEIYALKTEGK